MSADHENENAAVDDSGEPSPVSTRSRQSETATRRRPKVVWWIKIVLQPLLAVAAIALILFSLGVAQRFGWFTSNETNTSVAGMTGEDVQYICPMVCVPPSSEPGDCPVCGMELQAKKLSGDSKDIYGINIDPASIRIANIRTVAARAEILEEKIRAVGQISYDEGSLATISAYVDGRIEKLFADYTGVKVDKGDDLALLYSPELYSSQVALLESVKLLQAGQSPNQRIEKANQRLYESSRQRLIELGLTEQQVAELETLGKADSRIRIVSPIKGTVIDKMVVEGQYVNTGQSVFKVADLSTVWLMLELFPKDAAKIGFGQKVLTKIQSLPDQEFVGRVAFIDPSVDPTTQTVSTRVVIPNDKGLIRIGDFATASISVSANVSSDQPGAIYDPELAGKWISPRHPQVISDQPGQCTECGMDLVPASEFGFVSVPVARKSEVVVPRSAVLMAGQESVVYVETEPGRFEFRNVELDRIVGDQVAVGKGLAAGEMVAASAAFLVDSQFNMSGKPSLIDPEKAQRKTDEHELSTSVELTSALAELTDAQRHAVVQQNICPVTELALGSMGTPLAIDVAGQKIWICCQGCEGRLRDDPQKYLAVLERVAAAEQQPSPAMAQALSQLSDEDRQLAEVQRVCPIAGVPLGSMGTPVKVDVEGTSVFICCEGCRANLLKNPQKYLEKLSGGPGNPPSNSGADSTADPSSDNELPQMELPKMELPKMELPKMELPKQPPKSAGKGGA